MLSADAVVHQLYETEDVREAVSLRWGSVVFAAGEIDRGAIASRVFKSSAERHWLEELLWPRVQHEILTWRADQATRVPAPRARVVEIPLLFEVGMEGIFDSTIAVVADEQMLKRRAEASGHRFPTERLKQQLPQKVKTGKATFVINNSGSTDDLKEALEDVLRVSSSA